MPCLYVASFISAHSTLQRSRCS